MSCRNICKLCKNLYLSETITLSGNNVVIQIPQASFNDCQKVCIVTAQAIPPTAPISATVVIQLGTGPVLYPVQKCDGTALTAAGLRSRTRYKMTVHTTADSGVFRLCGHVCCPSNRLTTINGDGTPVTNA